MNFEVPCIVFVNFAPSAQNLPHSGMTDTRSFETPGSRIRGAGASSRRKNTVIPQRVDGFLRPTPEMKARDAYVPFLLSKPY